MKAFKIFTFGLLYGLLIKFAIDRIYQDNKIEDSRNENAALKEYIRSLEGKLQSKPQEAGSVTRATAQPEPVRTETGKDNLKTIKGIGPAIERRLNNAGIATFEALAQLTVTELENILGSTGRLVKDAGNLIAQATNLAQQKQ
ncbi:MAG TPA: helix-hairpin-helix domain-containing protein [Anaerolineales bacterium]|nr:helix-hairpin-helix domain-containing protein [Anaerolineales bacterium]